MGQSALLNESEWKLVIFVHSYILKQSGFGFEVKVVFWLNGLSIFAPFSLSTIVVHFLLDSIRIIIIIVRIEFLTADIIEDS